MRGSRSIAAAGASVTAPAALCGTALAPLRASGCAGALAACCFAAPLPTCGCAGALAACCFAAPARPAGLCAGWLAEQCVVPLQPAAAPDRGWAAGDSLRLTAAPADCGAARTAACASVCLPVAPAHCGAVPLCSRNAPALWESRMRSGLPAERGCSKSSHAISSRSDSPHGRGATAGVPHTTLSKSSSESQLSQLSCTARAGTSSSWPARNLGGGGLLACAGASVCASPCAGGGTAIQFCSTHFSRPDPHHAQTLRRHRRHHSASARQQ
jgi:hypothetical protein